MPSKKAAVLHGELESLVNAIILKKFPIGTIISNDTGVNPETYIGGKWEKLPDNTFLATKGLVSAGSEGGNNNAILVKHSHNSNSEDSGEGSIYKLPRWDSGESGQSGYLEWTNTGENFNYIGYGSTGTHLVNIHLKPHKHNISVNESGQDGTNKNMPRYHATYMFKRYA